MDNILLSLGLKSTAFKEGLADAQRAAGTAAGKIAGKFDFKNVGSTLATALGLNLQGIAEQVARVWTGVSKKTEEQYAELSQLSDQLTAKTLANFEARRTEEQKYQVMLKQRATLEERIANNAGASLEDQIRSQRDLLELANITGELEARDRALKAADLKEQEKWLDDIHARDTKRIEEQAAADKRRFAEQKKNVEEQVQLKEELRRMKFEAMGAEEQLADLSRQQSKHQRELVQAKQLGAETTGIEIELQKVSLEISKRQAEAEARRLLIAEKQVEAQKKNYDIYTKFMNLAVLGGLSSAQIQEASDSALREKLSRNNAAREPLLSDQGGAFRFGNSLEITRLENENRRIQAELDMREKLRKEVSFLGVDSARRNSKLDPLVFDRLVEQFVTGRSEQGETNDLLNDLLKQFNGQSSGQNNIATKIDKLTSATQAVATVLNTRGITTG